MRKERKIAMLAVLVLACILVVATASAAPRAKKACSDGVDNDGDGYTDLADPGCANKNDDSELDPNVECDDGSDNDGDSATDYNDSGCSGPTDDDETDCGDGVCEGGETSGTCPADCGYPDSCSDTDGGYVTSVFGTTSGYYNNNPYSNDDYCVDSSNIMEYYCSGNYEYSFSTSCGTDQYGNTTYCSGNDVMLDYTDYFCASGACDSDVTPVFQEDCDDNDGYGSNYCDGNIIKKDYNNYYCSGGACDYIATPEQVEDCDGSDGYGANYCLSGDVYRDYNDYYCSGAACLYTPTPELVEACQWGCTSGACDPASDSCSDTDGGYVTSVFGTTSGYYNNNPYSNDDYCVDSSNIMEYYCSGDYEYSFSNSCGTDSYANTSYCSAGDTIYKDYTDYFCLSGACDSNVTAVFQEDCDDNDGYGSNYCVANNVTRNYNNYYCTSGACDYTTTPETVETCEFGCTAGECDGAPDSCSDTDGGIIEWVVGTVSGDYLGSPYSDTDYCLDNTTLVEYFCSGNYALNYTTSCATNFTGCASGACY